MLQGLVNAVDAKDAYTRGHAQAVTEGALLLARELGLSTEVCSALRIAGLLHDVGKIGIPEAILGKPGRLSEDEFAVMRRHPVIGVEICRPLRSRLVRQALPIIRHHHERIDGRGYPDGLAGDAIPLLARIAAISDAYDAMTSDRPYRPGMSPAQALEILLRGAGTQWDAGLVHTFIDLLDGGLTARVTRSQLAAIA